MPVTPQLPRILTCVHCDRRFGSPQQLSAHLRDDGDAGARCPALTGRHPGQRVRLRWCADPHTRLPHAALGTVRFVDSAGTVHVDWDCGSSLGLIPGVDRWGVVR